MALFTCTDEQFSWMIIHAVFCVALELTIIPLAYMFIDGHFRDRSNNSINDLKSKTRNLELLLGVAFLLISLVCIPAQTPFIVHRQCISKDSEVDNYSIYVLLIANAVQYLLVQFIWLHRLYFSFKDSAFQISKCTIRIYTASFVVLCLLAFGIVCNFLFAAEPSSGFRTLLMLFSFTASCIHLSFCIVFITKLVRVYRHLQEHNNVEFAALIRKISVLSIISLMMTLCSTVATIFGLSLNEKDVVALNFLAYYLITFDQYSNCLCVMLSFKYFGTLYLIIFGVVDKCCIKCWRSVLHVEQKELAEMVSANSISGRSPCETSTPPDFILQRTISTTNTTAAAQSQPEIVLHGSACNVTTAANREDTEENHEPHSAVRQVSTASQETSVSDPENSKAFRSIGGLRMESATNVNVDPPSCVIVYDDQADEVP